MSKDKNSVYAEFTYQFTEEKQSHILREHFSSFLELGEKYNLVKQIRELTNSSSWLDLSKLFDKLRAVIKEEDRDLLDRARVALKNMSITAFIELDKGFQEFSADLLDKIEQWAKGYRYIYTSAYGVLDLEEYFLRSHNDFSGNLYKVTMDNNQIHMPSGDIIFGYTPNSDQSIILETALFDQEGEIAFADIVDMINSIQPDKLDSLSSVAAAFTYDAWVLDPVEFVKKIVNLEQYDNEQLKVLAHTLSILSPEWYEHGEALIQSAEKLVLTKAK